MWVIYNGKEIYIEQARILDPAAETIAFFDDYGQIKYAIRRDKVTAETAAAGSSSVLPVVAIAAAGVLAYMLLR